MRIITLGTDDKNFAERIRTKLEEKGWTVFLKSGQNCDFDPELSTASKVFYGHSNIEFAIGRNWV